MESIFIKAIKIKQVRHLKDMVIELDEKEKKHLLLTGKNGSGKTSLLKAIKYALYTEIQTTNPPLTDLITYIQLNIDDGSGYSSFFEGNFVLAYFQAKRQTNIRIPDGIKKTNLKEVNEIQDLLSPNFIQYLVNLKAEKSFAIEDGDTKTAKFIDQWFSKFEKHLKNIFEDPNLELIFDRKEYNFYFQLGNGNKVTINELSDGYSAIMNIITELILRMEKKRPLFYDMQGIVLIDEIEAHLHIDLQKKILPLLIDFFPNIQFIIATHSPFVLSSHKDCIIYDLEKKLRIEDATAYSYDALVESFFGSDKYSIQLQKKVDEYEKLAFKQKKSNEEINQFLDLKAYFERVSTDFAPELAVKLQQIKLARLTK